MNKAEEYATFLRTFHPEIIRGEVGHLTRLVVNNGPRARIATNFPQCPHERLEIATQVLKEIEESERRQGTGQDHQATVA